MKDMVLMRVLVKHFVPFLLFLCLARICTPTPFPPNPHNLTPKNPDAKNHFVLIHGAFHGAWCWYRLATLLKSVGYNVTALDMAASGINPKQAQQVHSLADYVEPLMDFMESLPPKERVILVGHSLGGAVISIAMERFPEKISVAVFATAVMPGPALKYLTIVEKLRIKLETATHSLLYELSPPEDLTLALSLLRFTPSFFKEIKLSEDKYGSVRRVYIMSDQDYLMTDIHGWMVEKNPPNEVKLIIGSDHMVMFSKPVELFSHLHNIAEKYAHDRAPANLLTS